MEIIFRSYSILIFDSFSAALLGLPKSLKEADVHAEYPSDTDDEYVTEQGFSPTLPGEYTRISNALALFRASRILSKVLEQNYPSATSHDLSLSSLTSLDEELREWSDELPTHLKLTFAQDKPSTDVTGNRSALLVSSTQTPFWAHADCGPVLSILLHPITNPQTCRWVHSWTQSLAIGDCTRGFKQAHNSDSAAVGRAKHVVFVLCEQE